jgi:hypothetical protein
MAICGTRFLYSTSTTNASVTVLVSDADHAIAFSKVYIHDTVYL